MKSEPQIRAKTRAGHERLVVGPTRGDAALKLLAERVKEGWYDGDAEYEARALVKAMDDGAAAWTFLLQRRVMLENGRLDDDALEHVEKA